MHTALLALSGLVLLVGTFVAWRRHQGWARTPYGLGVLWTLWFVELGVTGWLLLAAQGGENSMPEGPRRASLPEFAGQTVPADLAAGPSEVPTVLFVGDSFTAGQGVLEPDTLPTQVGAMLRSSGIDVRTVNHGREGRSFFDIATMQAVVGARPQADVVVWVHVLNDLGRGSYASQDDFIEDRTTARGTGWLAWDLLYAGWQKRRLEADTIRGYQNAVLDNVQTVQAAQALLTEQVSAERARGARVIFAIYPLMHDLQNYPFVEVHEALAAMARQAHAEVVDLLPAFTDATASDLWVSTLDHHPNAEGHRRAATLIERAIASAPIPEAGPVDCNAVSAPGPFVDAAREACAEGPTGWLDLADLLLAAPRPSPWSPMNQGELTRDLAITAAYLAPELEERAATIVRQAANKPD